MLLPPEGHIIEVQEWEWALLALYGERIWAYAVYGGEVFVYPVHYDPYGPYREIRYGKTVSMRQLMGLTVETFSPYIRGTWRVVDFGERTQHAHHKHHHETPTSAPMPDSLAACYALLGFDGTAEPEDVKTAYRNLARKIHPDVNRAANATSQMQAINDAYRRIMEDFDEVE